MTLINADKQYKSTFTNYIYLPQNVLYMIDLALKAYLLRLHARSYNEREIIIRKSILGVLFDRFLK